MTDKESSVVVHQIIGVRNLSPDKTLVLSSMVEQSFSFAPQIKIKAGDTIERRISIKGNVVLSLE
jgi:hypothetical protein